MKIAIEHDSPDHGILTVNADVYTDSVQNLSVLDQDDRTVKLSARENERIIVELYDEAKSRGMYVYRDEYDMYGVSRRDF